MKLIIFVLISIILAPGLHSGKVAVIASDTNSLGFSTEAATSNDERTLETSIITTELKTFFRNGELGPKILASLKHYAYYQGHPFMLIEEENLDTLLQLGADLRAQSPTDNKAISIFSLLPKGFNNAEMTSKILQLTDQDRAGKLETELIHYWLSGINPKTIFKEFSEYFGSSLPTKPELRLLVDFMTEYNKNPTVKKVSLYRMLKAVNPNTIRLLAEDWSVPRETNPEYRIKLISEVFNELLHDGVTPTSFLKDFHLPPIYLYEKPQSFHLWDDYHNEFNKQHPDKAQTVIQILIECYSTKTVVAMLDNAKMSNTPNAKTFVQRVLPALLDEWQNTKQTPNQVLDHLGLKVDQPHQSIQWNIWMLYLNRILKDGNYDYLNELDQTTLTKFLAAELDFPNLKLAAETLLTKRFDHYLAQRPVPLKALNFFDLDKNLLLISPIFEKWMKYAMVYKTDQNQEYEWIEALIVKYGNENTINIFIKGLQDSHTKEISKTITDAWYNFHLKHDTSPHDVFKNLFNRDDVTIDPLANPKFQLCMKYVDDFNRKHSEQKPFKKMSIFPMIFRSFSMIRTKKFLQSILSNDRENVQAKELLNELTATEPDTHEESIVSNRYRLMRMRRRHFGQPY